MLCPLLVLFDLFHLFVCVLCFFFFKQKTAYEMRISDWSSDVCSSDLLDLAPINFFNSFSKHLCHEPYRIDSQGQDAGNRAKAHRFDEHDSHNDGVEAACQDDQGAPQQVNRLGGDIACCHECDGKDRKSTRLNSSH